MAAAELICRLLALLRLYRTSFWSGMQAHWCSPVELIGAAVHRAGSRRSIMVYLVSDIPYLVQTEIKKETAELHHFHFLKF